MPELEAPDALQSVASEVPESRLGSMSLLAHLEELRKRVIYAFYGVLVGVGVGWYYVKHIYNYIQKPIVEVLQKHHMDVNQLTYLNPTDPFNMYLKIGLVVGLFIASPWVLYQVWMFISPGLYRHEKKYIIPFLMSTVGLFVAGGVFAYFAVFPAALDFLISFGDQFRPMITVQEYTGLFLTVVLGMGLIFEMPILIFFLAFMGVVSPGFLWRNFRYSILIIFVIAGIVTPTTDIMNQCIFAAPMIVLYFISIAVAWAVHPEGRARRAERRAAKAAQA
jgi:sec-independent protein translocase protein TatC